ncbi:MAG: hypothetical protein CMB73_05695 [Euryarchaeota archaeon]|jgi:trimethylguanosine synthase|nr:hypothetical protein [Euryarchaeota archaeon]|tara:strand:- start:569 stop:961 length:393 start_codon:yes stop_codon:yes gene_type:complete
MHADILMCTTNAENSKHYSDGKFLDSSLEKYWCQRYDLFREWESGILLDSEAWYSTTPVIIAEHQADVCLNLYGKRFCEQTSVLVLDMFCGVGGNAIAFAKSGYKVIACDTDSTKLKMVTLRDYTEIQLI